LRGRDGDTRFCRRNRCGFEFVLFLEAHQLHVDVLLLEFKQLLLLAQKLFAHPLSLLLLALLQRSGVTLCKFCWIYQYFVPPVGGGGGCGSRNVANRPGRVDGVDLGVQLLELGGEEGGASPRMPQFIHRGTDLFVSFAKDVNKVWNEIGLEKVREGVAVVLADGVQQVEMRQQTVGVNHFNALFYDFDDDSSVRFVLVSNF